ncbi:MAG: hypothetical protein AABY22_12840, partial [Nanoarchaeota archaeon]
YKSVALKDLGLRYSFIKTSLLLKNLVKQKDIDNTLVKIGCDNTKGYGFIEPQVLEKYLTQDVELTRKLYNKALEIGIPEYYMKIDQKLIEPILKMELNGFKIDSDKLKILQQDLMIEIEKLGSYFKELNINPRSTKQIGKYMETQLLK